MFNRFLVWPHFHVTLTNRLRSIPNEIRYENDTSNSVHAEYHAMVLGYPIDFRSQKLPILLEKKQQ